MRVHAEEVLKSKTSKLLVLLATPVPLDISFLNVFHFIYIDRFLRFFFPQEK